MLGMYLAVLGRQDASSAPRLEQRLDRNADSKLSDEAYATRFTLYLTRSSPTGRAWLKQRQLGFHGQLFAILQGFLSGNQIH